MINKRTFEIIGKWVAKQTGITVAFQDGPAHCNAKSKTIYLPNDLDANNALSALALIMHEAGHMRDTARIPEDKLKLMQGTSKVKHELLNVIEDVRIDNRNFNLLPNVRAFYKDLYDKHIYTKSAELIKKKPLTHRVLVNAILMSQGFDPVNDPQALQMIKQHGVQRIVGDSAAYIEYGCYDEVRKNIDKLAKILNMVDEEQPQPQGEGEGEGEGEGNGSGSGQGSGNEEQQGDGKSNDGEQRSGEGEGKSKGKGTGEGLSESVGEMLHPSSGWGSGDAMSGGSTNELSPAALDEITKQKFTELLNVKEMRVVWDGVKLNTDSLTSFYTGDVDELFVDDDVEKRKKSKLIFVLDGSGSMDTGLLDRASGRKVVAKTMKALASILDEVRETEGINVDYRVWGFTTHVHKFNQDNWEYEYNCIDGGTRLFNAFREAQDEILNDPEVDGNKLIVVLTDGAVNTFEIDNIRQSILQHNEDVRVMIVGVGADMAGPFAKMCGDRIILAEEHANEVILETLTDMLG
jgi:hypothetical protein